MTTTATMNLCKDCWHVTDSDHCPECGAGEHNRGAASPFLTDLTVDDIRSEMVRERDRVAADARVVHWANLDPDERDETRQAIGARDGDAWDMGAGPWLTFDDEAHTVTVGMWVTEKLGDDDPDAWNVDEVVIPIGEES